MNHQTRPRWGQTRRAEWGQIKLTFPDTQYRASRMFLSYFDDSGERGVLLLAGVVVHDSRWSDLQDAWFDYRRWLRNNFGVPIQKAQGRRRPHVELKGTDFANGSGPWRGLPVGRAGRLRAMRSGLRVIGNHAHVFAVAWMPNREMTGAWPARHDSPLIDTWTTCLERLATYSQRHPIHSGDRVMTITDQGNLGAFRTTFRRMRRFHYVGSLLGGSLSANAPMFVDDPSERDSRDSSFIQMADLAAYAALREVRPLADVHSLWPQIDGGTGTATEGILRAVNMRTHGQPPGIKLIPD